MKKYLLGMTAIVLAIGFSAFTKPAAKPFDLLGFKISASDAAVSGRVADNTKWVLQSPALDCAGQDNEIACMIFVDAQFTKDVSGVTKLRTSTDGSPYVTITQANGDNFSTEHKYIVSQITNTGGSSPLTPSFDNAEVQ
jgi:hypothetical protein